MSQEVRTVNECVFTKKIVVLGARTPNHTSLFSFDPEIFLFEGLSKHWHLTAAAGLSTHSVTEEFKSP